MILLWRQRNACYKNSEEFFRWCRVRPEDLPRHPQAKVKLRIVATPQAMYEEFANTLVEEVKSHNAARRPTRWILPCGPRGQYPIFVERVNRERISLRNIHIFHMDDHLDRQGRHLPLDHPFCYEGWMTRNFYEQIDFALNVPLQQRHFPRVSTIDEIAAKIREIGDDSTYGGIGYRGHIAYNEPTRSPWYRISVEEFLNCTARPSPD